MRELNRWWGGSADGNSDSTGGGGVCECGCSRAADGGGRESDRADVPGRELPKISGICRVARGVIIN